MLKKFSIWIISGFLITGFGVLLASQPAVSKHEIVYFYSEYCSTCKQADAVIQELHASSLKVAKHDIDGSGNTEQLLKQYCEEYDVSEEKIGIVPAVFFGKRFWIGRDIINFKTEIYNAVMRAD